MAVACAPSRQQQQKILADNLGLLPQPAHSQKVAQPQGSGRMLQFSHPVMVGVRKLRVADRLRNEIAVFNTYL